MKWSDNPALIVRDLLKKFDDATLRKGCDMDFNAMADYCDQQGLSMSAFLTTRGGTPETYSKIPGA